MPFTGPADDRLAIRELLDCYANAVTRGDADAWGATWTDGAEWSLPDYPEIGTTRGRSAIVAPRSLVRDCRYEGGRDEGLSRVRVRGLARRDRGIEVSGNTTHVRSYTAEVYARGGMTMRDRGAYDDVCVEEHGRWRFKSRSFSNIHRQLRSKGACDTCRSCPTAW